jgi:uncharacterized protein (TIGR04222 family)
VAYLTGGPALAVTTALGSLRSRSSVGTAGNHRLSVAGPLTADATALDRAIHNAIANSRATSVRRLPADFEVAAALQELAERLSAAKLLLSREARQLLRWATLPVVAVLALGALRWWSGITNDRPVIFLTIAIAVLAIVEMVLLRRTALRTRAGDRALAALRSRYRHLAPESNPAWSHYGPLESTLAVGLFGGAVLWAADPAFASDAGLEQHRIQDGSSGWSSWGGSSSSGSSSSGSSCGSSSSCSSGSSCGGGGGCGG